jgi:hypothetical protein
MFLLLCSWVYFTEIDYQTQVPAGVSNPCSRVNPALMQYFTNIKDSGQETKNKKYISNYTQSYGNDLPGREYLNNNLY